MTIMELISRHLPGHKAEDFDIEADARAHYAAMIGSDMPLHERRERALRLFKDALSPPSPVLP